jgi:hypothetical protein
MRNIIFMAVLAMATLLMLPGSSQAVEIDFSAGTVGDLGTDTFVDPGTGLTVQGLYLDGGVWTPANLFRRNETNDHGFGVCNPGEQPCPGPPGGGDINELDNAEQSELIVLQLPAGYEWVSVQISSMDPNPGFLVPERGILYADYDGVLSTTFGLVGDTQLETFTGGVDPLEAIFKIDPAYSQAPYLVFEPFDHTGGATTNNDYLVYKATIRPLETNGCTPGYWKQARHFDSWVGYSPGDLFDVVFGVTSTFPAETLLQVLKQGGGKEKALGRHAVAALLNSTNPDVSYAFTTAEVIAIVQQAYATGQFNAAKNLLEAENQSGCPLN